MLWTTATQYILGVVAIDDKGGGLNIFERLLMPVNVSIMIYIAAPLFGSIDITNMAFGVVVSYFYIFCNGHVTGHPVKSLSIGSVNVCAIAKC